MKLKLALLGPLFFSLMAFASNREIIKELYPFVGKLNYQGVSCSAFIIKHGVLVTAKHCFSHHDFFPEDFKSTDLKVSFSNFVLEGQEGSELVFDRGENDLSYIIYNPNLTQDKIDLTKIEPSLDVDDNTSLFRVGFPGVGDFIDEKVLTYDCNYLGDKEFFPPKILDPGYEGILLDTTCQAWHGDSGGPVIRKSGKKLQILGVLSHTFEVDYAGRIKEESMGEDHIGPYVKTSMFSPFSETVDLDFYLRD